MKEKKTGHGLSGSTSPAGGDFGRGSSFHPSMAGILGISRKNNHDGGRGDHGHNPLMAGLLPSSLFDMICQSF